MLDFLYITTKSVKKDVITVYPKFIIKKSSDLMIRGGDFYAVWDERNNLWSTDEQVALELIDVEVEKYVEKNKHKFDGLLNVSYMWDSSSGMIDAWHKYCQKQMRDSFHSLDEKIFFSNDITTKKDYASKKLNYPLEKTDISAYNKLMSTLYNEEERKKIEWAIGSIITGDSKHIQKFLVLYGAQGTGKSTVLNLIQKLFDGYYSVFDAKALGSSSNSFALEAFKSNPLVAIQHDGDLSRIEDNTRLNSLVSHELMTVNEKFKSTYANRFNSFLFLGTNKPVKITDAKSGLIRRLIDVSPSGKKLGIDEYRSVLNTMSFELSGIAYHCKEVYLKDPNAYDDYIPITMMGASNDFFNFMLDSYFVFKKENNTTLKASWEMYKTYCDGAHVPFPYPQRIFKEELKNYFEDYKERYIFEDGTRVRSFYSGFKTEKIDGVSPKEEKNITVEKTWLDDLKEQVSIFDNIGCDYPAQYSSSKGAPLKKWSKVKTKLSDIDTKELHYVKLPENHIVIDFDIKNSEGEKDIDKNIKEASKFPQTYAELSKSGEGLHLHYIYTGDVNELSRIYDDNIEIKIFTGDSSLRRKLSKCNNLPISSISTGLPIKGGKMISFEGIKSERALRTLIKRNLNKEIHPSTKSSIDFINKILEDAYNSNMKYNVTDMYSNILYFASNSTNQSEYCVKLVSNMKFKSEDITPNIVTNDEEIIFYDVEVFPNLFLVCWKKIGEGNKVVKLINPSPKEIEKLLEFKLVGFNCRKYDNHILYARLMGYNNEQLYNLSQKIIKGDKKCLFGEAYNISYTDVYDFSSEKKSLKKFEIALGIHHKELGIPWDEPVPEDMWVKVSDYCVNDVIATEAVFHSRKSDFTARQILAEIAGLTVNDTTNTLTTKIIFGDDKNPQKHFNYRDMGNDKEVRNFTITDKDVLFDGFGDPEYTVFDKNGRPIFPGYKYEYGTSTYRGEIVGEGGYVYAEPGMYSNVDLLDIASMHPSTIVAENLFGDKYTKKFKELLDVRIAIKHKDFDSVKNMFNGILSKYLTDEKSAKDLSYALKIAINSVYGLTSANFNNSFRDNRNVDNIVAKRGALFMINLKHEVQARGYTVAHIKTDSIKIPDADEEIRKFIFDYGEQYGYTFEWETTYEKMCLVNNAVYISKDCNGEWSATGTQFQIPYVFKKLFSKEEIQFEDMCETKSVKTSIYLDFNENLPDVSLLEKEYDKNIDKMDEEEKECLKKKISEGHNYKFIGRVGLFTPVKDGFGGGILCRESDGKYHAVTGTKGYRWLESEMVKNMNNDDCIDKSYYNKLVDEAVETISKYGDFEWFTEDLPF